jgi:hypothetical protein
MLANILKGATAPATPTGITLVGINFIETTTNPTTIALTGLTGGLASSAIAGDLVFVINAVKGGTNATFTVSTSGYTQLVDLYANSTEDSNMGVFYKRLTTAETSVTISNSQDWARNVVAVIVWRNVNSTTPFDATRTTATFTNTGRPDPPSITTVTNNAVVFVLGMAAGALFSPLSDLTAPSGMSNFYEILTGVNTNNQAAFGMASILRATAGAYNPPTFGGGSTSSSASAIAVTIALRPA